MATASKQHCKSQAFVSFTASYLQSESAKQGVEIAALVNYLLMDAINTKASDIHIEPWDATLVVRLRLNGVLRELVHLPLDLTEKVVGRLKVMAELDISKSGLPQEGHASTPPELGRVELRVSVFPTVRGEKVVIRIFDPSSRSFDLAALGFEESTLEKYLHMLTKTSGLILLTGPTGSGKTTAIYASIYYLVQKHGTTISISTVEDPVEYQLATVSQAKIHNIQGFTYPVALRSLMRQDPQVILIGEIRDPETAAIAVQAGMTGHLVISTIHSGTTAGVFARLINMDIEPFLLASSIIGVMGVRLVRKNCQYCAQPYEPEPALLRMMTSAQIEHASFRRGGGCTQCAGTGFIGRTSITELMITNDPIRDGLMMKKPSRVLQQLAVDAGMDTLWDTGIRRVMAGLTPLEEIVRVVAVDQL